MMNENRIKYPHTSNTHKVNAAQVALHVNYCREELHSKKKKQQKAALPYFSWMIDESYTLPSSFKSRLIKCWDYLS